MRRLLGILTIAASLAGGAACTRPAQPPTDVLLITIDTARADRFSFARDGAPATPSVDGLARDGVAFLDAVSPVPLTKPAHASLLTGRLPPSHTVRDNGAFRLPASETTLAEVLAAQGFATAAFVGAQVLDSRYGFDQGFATYDDAIPESGDPQFLAYAERRGEEVAASAARWLAATQAPRVFVWVHLFDPHAPYRAPEPERSRAASPYDGEIAYADRVVGQILDAWKASRSLDSTLVIVTSDHGEGLGEHGEATHGVLVHEATLRVPLVMRGPGLPQGGRVASLVSLIDVAPTILSLLSIAPPPGVEGRDLVPVARGTAGATPSVTGYAESLYAQLHHGCTPLHALREDRFKLVVGLQPELYDLAADPAEARDLARSEPDRTARMQEELETLTAELTQGESETVTLDDEARRALESLGYVSAAYAASGEAKRDPREALATLHRMAEADRRVLQGDAEGAIAEYRAVLDNEPGSVDARVRLAQILITQKRADEAVKLLAAAAGLAPDEAYLPRKLGDTLASLRRYDEALAAYDSGRKRHPASRELRNGRWRVLNQLGRHKTMLEEADRAVAADPSDGTARWARAVACCGSGSDADYVEALERELAQLPGDPVLTKALAEMRAPAPKGEGP